MANISRILGSVALCSVIFSSSLSATSFDVRNIPDVSKAQEIDVLALASNGVLNESMDGVKVLSSKEEQEVRGGGWFAVGILVGYILGSKTR